MLRVAIIGGGRVGTGFGFALLQAGHAVYICDDERHGISALLRENERIKKFPRPSELPESTDIVLLAVPDGALADTDASVTWSRDITAIHCSGALPSTILKSAQKAGCSVASLHPALTITSVEHAPSQFASVPLVCEGGDAAVRKARELTGEFADPFIRSTAEQKALHHQACMFSSNFISVLQWRAAQLWRQAGFEESAIKSLTSRFVADYGSNLNNAGISGAVSGPVVRGDLQTIASHIDSLRSMNKDISADFRMLCIRAAELLLSEPDVAAEQQKRLNELLILLREDKD